LTAQQLGATCATTATTSRIISSRTAATTTS
jgi:hypothetical protein